MKKLLILVFIASFCVVLSAGYNWDGRVIWSKHGATKDSLGYFIIELDGAVFDTFGIVDTLIVLRWQGRYVWIGNAGTVNYADGDGDLYIEDELEVDGPAWLNVMICVTSDTIASAATLVLTNHNNFVITGTANIDSIDQSCAFPNWAIAYIEFTGIAAANGIVDGKNLKLAGNFVYSADDMIMLQRRGNIFYEVSRSAN